MFDKNLSGQPITLVNVALTQCINQKSTYQRLPLQGANLNIGSREGEVANKSSYKYSRCSQDGNERVGCWVTKPVLLTFSPPH